MHVYMVSKCRYELMYVCSYECMYVLRNTNPPDHVY